MPTVDEPFGSNGLVTAGGKTFPFEKREGIKEEPFDEEPVVILGGNGFLGARASFIDKPGLKSLLFVSGGLAGLPRKPKNNQEKKVQNKHEKKTEQQSVQKIPWGNLVGGLSRASCSFLRRS